MMDHGRISSCAGCLATIALCGLFAGTSIGADAPVARSEQTNPNAPTIAFAVPSGHRAPWQQKLTLGPGDVLTFSLYGEERELTRRDVPIGPDGRVSYLEAQGIMAAGLTVDALRNRLNEELGKFRRTPRAYVVPVAYKSKRYYILGAVAEPGAFLLERPTSLIEAVVHAGGIRTGMPTTRTAVERVDLARSFITRGGRKLPVDFEKLFVNGDLSQNVALEPNDYIHVRRSSDGGAPADPFKEPAATSAATSQAPEGQRRR